MLNRRIFMSMAAILPGLGAASAARAAAATKDSNKKHHVAYHVSEPGRVKFTLGNIRNHINGVGGPENIEIVLVVHGPALKLFNVLSGDQTVLGKLARLQKEAGVSFRACGNTMNKLKLGMNDLPKGAVHLSQGGVVHLMELQEAGFAYLRP